MQDSLLTPTAAAITARGEGVLNLCEHYGTKSLHINKNDYIDMCVFETAEQREGNTLNESVSYKMCIYAFLSNAVSISTSFASQTTPSDLIGFS
jgi:hypothetical protein